MTDRQAFTAAVGHAEQEARGGRCCPAGRVLRAILGRTVPALAAAAFLAATAPDLAAQVEVEEPKVTIAAERSSHGFGIDDVVFELTRSGPKDVAISVQVSLVQADLYLAEGELNRVVEFAADATAAELRIGASLFDGPATESGVLKATLVDASGYRVGRPNSAQTRMLVKDPAITVRPERASYSIDGDDGEVRVTFIARTAPDLPRPGKAFSIAVSSKAGDDDAVARAETGALSQTIDFKPRDFAVDGGEWEARKTVSISMVEGARGLDVKYQRAASTPERIRPRNSDGSTCTDDVCMVPVFMAQRDEPTLTIAASQESYAFGIDNVVFTVTRNGTAEGEISGAVTLAQDEDFLDTNFLRLDFTIAADETSTDMMAADKKSTNIVLSAALFDGDATQSGNLTATIEAGDGYTVGTPGTATVRMVVADSTITVRPEHAAYSFDEDNAAASVKFVARTATRPNAGFSVTVSAKARSDGAGSPDDYASLSEIVRFDPADFDESDDEWEALKEVALTIVDDGEAEDDETFDLKLGMAPGQSARIELRQADGSACPAEGCLTPVTIVDNEVPALVATHDTATTPVDTALEVPVLENDIYVGRKRHLLGVSKVTGSVHGTTRVNQDRTGVVFVPDTGYSGIARFTYTVSDETLTDTAAVIVSVGGAEGAGVGVPVWEARWSSMGSGSCTTFSLGVENTNPDVRVADDEWIAVTLHVDRQRSTVDENEMEAKDASGNIQDPHPFTPNIHHDGGWVYVVGTTAGTASTVMTVEVEGVGGPPCDGTLVAWVYVDGWLAGRDRLTVEPRAQQQALARTPPALRVSDAQAVEASGASLRFPVTLDAPAETVVSVRYRTSDGTATAGSDYEAASGALTFEPGQTSGTVSVAVLDDDLDEGSETLTLTLSYPNPSSVRLADAEATGTISNTDKMPKAWIARFGRTVADQVLDAVESRMRAARQPGVEVTLAGQRFGGQAPQEASRKQRDSAWQERTGFGSPASRGVTQDELLSGTSFAVTAETGRHEYATLWGRGAATRFEGREGNLTLDGEVASAMVGADWAREDWTAGLIVSRSVGEGHYAGHSEGRVEATLTGFYPWGSLALSEQADIWGAAGYGTGELSVTPKKPGTDEDAATTGADLDLRMAAAGLRGSLLDGTEDGLALVATTDALIVQTASGAARGPDGGNLAAARASITRLRLGLEGSQSISLGDGATLTPSVEIGVRHDGGDAETGFGIDFGGGIAWSDPKSGLSAELRGHALLTHEADGFRERGVSASLAWDPKPSSAFGPTATLTQTVGDPASGGADALLAQGALTGLAAQPGSELDGEGDLQHRRLEARFGYGFPAWDGRLASIPEIGLGLSDTGREYILGWRLSSDGPGALQLSTEARRIESMGSGPAEHRIGARLSARW